MSRATLNKQAACRPAYRNVGKEDMDSERVAYVQNKVVKINKKLIASGIKPTLFENGQKLEEGFSRSYFQS